MKQGTNGGIDENYKTRRGQNAMRRYTEIINLKVTKDQKARVSAYSEALGVTMNSYIRCLLDNSMPPDNKIKPSREQIRWRAMRNRPMETAHERKK